VPIKISVIIPTYNRSQFLKKILNSLLGQTQEKCDYEIIVVDDGSTDDTSLILNTIKTSYNFKFVRQKNAGLSAARNHGATQAQGEILLFLDDDIVASSELIKEHLLSHTLEKGKKAVIGYIRSDESILKEPMASFFEYSFKREYERMATHHETVSANDVRGGNFSIRKNIFLELGMFDDELGRIANEDGEFAYRFEKAGGRFIFNPKAIGYHLYQKGFKESIAKAHCQGRAAVLMRKKHPESIWKYDLGKYHKGPFLKRILREFLLRLDDSSFLLKVILELINLTIHLPLSFFRFPLLRFILDYSFWIGVKNEAEKNGDNLLRYKNNMIPILAYHRIGEGRGLDLKEYSIPGESFRKQMLYLKQSGFNSISLNKLIEFLKNGEPLPAKPVAITFDDGFKETLENTLPVLAKYRIEATFFIVAEKAGKRNDWDEKYKDSLYPLASFDNIRMVKEETIQFESHSLTHKKLNRLSEKELFREITLSKQIIEKELGKEVRFFSYPYGKYDEEAKRVAKEAGYLAAFSVKQGMVKPQDDFFELKRVEIFRSDGFLEFLSKVKTGVCIKKYFKNLLLKRT